MRRANDMAGKAAGVGQLLYIYAILEAGSALADAVTSGVMPAMITDEPLFGIAGSGLLAAVSRVPDALFEEAPLNLLLQDLAQLAPFAVGHEAVVRTLSDSEDPILPMSFGAVFRGSERIEAMLVQRAPELRLQLQYLRGKQEWGVRVEVDRATVIAAVRAGHDMVNRTSEAANLGPGRAYLLGKRREQLIAEEARRQIAAGVAQIQSCLAVVSVGLRHDTIAAQDSERLLALKAALLVEKARTAALHEAVAALDTAWRPRGLELSLSGPWAPYSFTHEVDARAVDGTAHAER